MRNTMIPLLAVALFGGSARSAGANSFGTVAGTYELIICKSACSFADPQNVFTRAAVVLFKETMTQRNVASLDPTHTSHPFGPAKGCYRLNHIAKADSFVQINTTGVTSWQLIDGTLEFSLFGSPDAGYFVHLKQNGRLLEGEGQSFGAGVANPHYSTDVVIGRR
jgi:hypothetical protein